MYANYPHTKSQHPVLHDDWFTFSFVVHLAVLFFINLFVDFIFSVHGCEVPS